MKKIYFLLCCICSMNAFATIIYVNKNATGANNGASWTNAYLTIEQAFGDAVLGDQIWVASGVYKPAGTTTSATFNIPNGVAVYGSFTGTETTLAQRDLTGGTTTTLNGDIGTPGINTDNCRSVVKFENSSNLTILDGFKIINGNASSIWGGAIRISEGQPIIRNCELIANSGADGGAVGIYAQPSNITTFISCKIRNNTTTGDGGAIWVSGGTIKLIDCDISGNTADNGGAVGLSQNALLVADRTVFSGNNASTTGGVVFVEFSTSSAEMYNSLIVGNVAFDGSVIGFEASNYSVNRIVNCTIASNRNTSSSGSFTIQLASTSCYFYNNILSGNIAPKAIYKGNVANSIIEGINNADNNVNVSTTAPTFVNAGLAAAAPFTIDGYDYHLMPGSNGINMGDNTLASAVYNLNLDGAARIYDTTVDMGAYEFGTLSIDNPNAQAALTMYPNPATDMMYIRSEAGNLDYQVYNVNGRLLHKGNTGDGLHKMDVSGFATGIYLVKFSNGQTRKLVKQ